MEKINLWLDDIRPAPIGWLHVKTVAEAKLQLEAKRVKRASLDHDLGACDACMAKWRENLVVADAMPNCDHFGTGYDLVCWMEETDFWPDEKPTVHSANPVGRKRMQQVIDKAYDAKSME